MEGKAGNQGQDLAGAERTLAESRRELVKLRRELDYLTLVTQSLWDLTKEKTGLQDADIMARIREFDMKDGKIDGRLVRTPEPCPKCSRMLSLDTNACMFCGIKVDRTKPF